MYMMVVPAATPEVSIQDESSSEYSSLEARINSIGSMGLIEKRVFSTKVTQQLTAIQLLNVSPDTSLTQSITLTRCARLCLFVARSWRDEQACSASRFGGLFGSFLCLALLL